MAWSHLSLGLVSFNAVQFAKLNMVHLPCTSPSMPTLLCNAALISVPPDFSSPTSPTSPAHQNETLRASGFREVENVFISLYFEFCRRTTWMLVGGLRGERRSLFLPKFGEGAAAVVRYHIFSRADLQSVECLHRISCQKWKYSEKLALELVESVY